MSRWTIEGNASETSLAASEPSRPLRADASEDDGVARQSERRSSTLPAVRWKGSDAQLLELARHDSNRVPGAVYDRFGGLINRLVWRILGADPEHDDLVHQVFLQVVQNIARVRDPEALRGWIATVTVNTVRSHLRRRWLRRALVRTDSLVTSSALAPAPDYEARRVLQATYDILERLPAQERIAFTLHHIDKRKLTEVAKMVGCSLATLKRRILRADRRFCKMANRDPNLRDRVRGSPLAARFDLHD